MLSASVHQNVLRDPMFLNECKTKLRGQSDASQRLRVETIYMYKCIECTQYFNFQFN